jgi:hypothetical protein
MISKLPSRIGVQPHVVVPIPIQVAEHERIPPEA